MLMNQDDIIEPKLVVKSIEYLSKMLCSRTLECALVACFLWGVVGCLSSKSPGFDGGIDAGDVSETESSQDSGVADAAVDPWAWNNNPEGEFCGDDCTQLTFTEHVAEQEWDIWGDHLVFRDEEGAISIVNINEKKTLRIPDIHMDYPIGSGVSEASWPTIFEDRVYYVLSVYGAVPARQEIVAADPLEEKQDVIWLRESPDSSNDRLPMSLDVFDDRLIAAGGAGNPEVSALSVFAPPWPTSGEALINQSYGEHNSIWENVVVFWDERVDPTNISAYDFERGEVFTLVDDLEYQYAPRIQGRRIVYMDFRLDESDPWGSWYKAMVVMLDLDTAKRLRITNGSSIAAHPDIYNNIVVWMDYRACSKQKKGNLSCVEIWGLNFDTGTRMQLTYNEARPKAYPRIWEHRIFVHMFAEDFSTDAIYMFELPEEIR